MRKLRQLITLYPRGFFHNSSQLEADGHKYINLSEKLRQNLAVITNP